MKGEAQVYTDNGKGEAAAALGLVIRSLCIGRKVVIGQFVKGMTYGRLRLPDYLKNLSLEQFGWDRFVYRKLTDEDCEKAVDGLVRTEAYLEDEGIDLLIFDEINVAYEYRLIDSKEVVDLLKRRPKTIGVVLTGRYAPQEFISFADLMTEMKEVKHYYKKGLKAGLGIEY